jgi:hypothetical protein
MDELKYGGKAIKISNAMHGFTHNLYVPNAMMSVIHQIETKDTGNPLMCVYNKIKELITGFKLSRFKFWI